jgi:hypothetical protein
MAYEISRLRILVETDKVRESVLSPNKYVIAAFNEDIGEEPPIKHIADEYQIPATSVPAVRFIDTEEVDIDIIYETGEFSKFNRHRAKVARKYHSIFDGLEQCQKDCIPKEVAIARKSRPAVAMYLFAFDEYDYLDLAMEFDVSIEAVQKYRQRVLSDSFLGN